MRGQNNISITSLEIIDKYIISKSLISSLVSHVKIYEIIV